MNTGILMLQVSLSAPVFAESAQDLNAWTYRKDWDRLSNADYSLVRSPMPNRALYDNLRLEIICKEKKLQLAVDSKKFITSQNKAFDFEYQIDQNKPVSIPMKTYPNSKLRGYTEEHSERIANDLLTGQSVFILVNTLINTVLSGSIPLSGAGMPIRQVLADCGLAPPDRKGAGADYSLADFESDFKRLSPEQQRHILDQIKQMVEDIL
ncbi:MAG: hypothetical protein ACU841_08045 [Gammaproteobacteria bacterium]